MQGAAQGGVPHVLETTASAGPCMVSHGPTHGPTHRPSHGQSSNSTTGRARTRFPVVEFRALGVTRFLVMPLSFLLLEKCISISMLHPGLHVIGQRLLASSDAVAVVCSQELLDACGKERKARAAAIEAAQAYTVSFLATSLYKILRIKYSRFIPK